MRGPALVLIEKVMYMLLFNTIITNGFIFTTTKVPSMRILKWRESLPKTVVIPYRTGINKSRSNNYALNSKTYSLGGEEGSLTNSGMDSLKSLEEDTSLVLKKSQGNADTTFYPGKLSCLKNKFCSL